MLKPTAQDSLVHTFTLLLLLWVAPVVTSAQTLDQPPHHKADNNRQILDLYRASSQGLAVEVQKLLSSGVDVNSQDYSGATALHHAALHGQLGVVRLLINSHAQVNSVEKKGNTALHACASAPLLGGVTNLEVVELLLRYGADPNAPNKCCGRTPLHLAALTGNSVLVRLLLQYGANPKSVTPDGKTPYDDAVVGGDQSCMEILQATCKPDNAKTKEISVVHN